MLFLIYALFVLFDDDECNQYPMRRKKPRMCGALCIKTWLKFFGTIVD